MRTPVLPMGILHYKKLEAMCVLPFLQLEKREKGKPTRKKKKTLYDLHVKDRFSFSSPSPFACPQIPLFPLEDPASSKHKPASIIFLELRKPTTLLPATLRI